MTPVQATKVVLAFLANRKAAGQCKGLQVVSRDGEATALPPDALASVQAWVSAKL